MGRRGLNHKYENGWSPGARYRKEEVQTTRIERIYVYIHECASIVQALGVVSYPAIVPKKHEQYSGIGSTGQNTSPSRAKCIPYFISTFQIQSYCSSNWPGRDWDSAPAADCDGPTYSNINCCRRCDSASSTSVPFREVGFIISVEHTAERANGGSHRT